MGASASAVSDNDDKMITPGDIYKSDDDMTSSSVNVSTMRRKPCSVSPKLKADPKRKAPPVNPQECINGSIGRGMDEKLYIIQKRRWRLADKVLTKEQLKEATEILGSKDVKGSPSSAFEQGKSPAAQMKELERKRVMKISDMKRKTCAVDPKLKNSTRKAPPIHPRTCKEGSRSLGNDGRLYVIRKGKSGSMRWALENELSEAERKAARKRLGDSGPKKSPKTPKRKKGKSVLSRIPAAASTPSGKKYKKKASTPKKKASARIPAAARTPKGKKYN